MDHSTDLPAIAGTTHTTHHTTHHKTLDLISEIEADIKAVTTVKTDRTLTGTTTEIEGTNKTISMTRGTDSKTGMITTDSITGDDQTNINTTKTNQRHR